MKQLHPKQTSLFHSPRPLAPISTSLRNRPKIDLHRHLLGSISPTIFVKIAEEYGLPLPAESLAAISDLLTFVQPVNGLKPFFRPWQFVSKLLTRPEVVTSLVYNALEDAAHDNVIYTEFRASWGMTGQERFSVKEFLAAARIGITRAEQDFGVFGRVVLGVTRHLFARHAAWQRRRLWFDILDAASEYRDSVVVGFDLSGIEEGYPPSVFVEEFDQVYERGFPITIHCGETMGAEDIWHTLQYLHPSRISHALSAVGDEQLLDHLAELRLPIEICPTSNWLTGTVQDLKSHPMRTMHEKNLKLTVNTDDPAVCQTTMSSEYELVGFNLGFSNRDLDQLMSNSLSAMFGDQELRRVVTEKLKDGSLADHEGGL
jgi:adenosine deaminase